MHHTQIHFNFSNKIKDLEEGGLLNQKKSELII